MHRVRKAWRLALGLALLMPACRPEKGEPPDPSVWGVSTRRAGTKIVMSRQTPQRGEPAEVLEILGAELARNLEQLQERSIEPQVYFLAYDLVAMEELYVVGEDGVLVADKLGDDRSIDVDIRVGSPQLDNSHPLDGDYGPGNGLGSGLPVSVDDEPLSLAQSLWLDTEAQYRNAIAAYRETENAEQLRSEGKKDHPDFSSEKRPTVHIEPPQTLDFEELHPTFRELGREVSAALSGDPRILHSNVTLTGAARNRFLVTSEGTRVQSGDTRLRITMDVHAQAGDGMRLQRVATFDVHSADQLPEPETLVAAAHRLRDEVLALREAPIAEPYTGPAVLEGRAAGVFFHEIFGHRLEGHRQKDDLEGQTFTGKLGKKILPWFLDVVDDPTVTTLGGNPLSGHYFVDDEGIRSTRAVLVERGKLKGFLLARSPVLPFTRSNGHGRRQPGYQVVARQGNLIVTSRKTLSQSELRAALLDEIRRQDKPYGLLFKDIEGGYTLTDRSGPQAFKVQPLMVYKVFADGRPDQLVRGVEIVGTPLSAFETIIATDDEPGIFNGMCGAESGWVPVSAVSPSLLLRSIEIERGVHERDRPPLLAAPGELGRPEATTPQDGKKPPEVRGDQAVSRR